jgi:bifunctional non-homologous end joining protein LigD
MVKPMLATLVDKPFDGEGWFFEIKWDGYRAIAETGARAVKLYSRNGLSFSGRYGPVMSALKKIKRRAILDGEIVVVDKRGRSSFQDLQNYEQTHEGNLQYQIFDILSLDGKDLRQLPLKERKAILKKFIPRSAELKYSDHVIGKGKAFFVAAKRQGLEGIMAKNSHSPYQENVRGGDWLKIKTHLEQEVVIGGFTEPLRSRKYFGALVVGYYAKGKLKYAGHVGGGFDEKKLRELSAKMKPLIVDKSPFADKIKTNTDVTWVKPKLVCEVKFAEWTGNGTMRQPIFIGLRTDKPAKDVIRERSKRV